MAKTAAGHWVTVRQAASRPDVQSREAPTVTARAAAPAADRIADSTAAAAAWPARTLRRDAPLASSTSRIPRFSVSAREAIAETASHMTRMPTMIEKMETIFSVTSPPAPIFPTRSL